MVLLGDEFYSRGESLYLSFEGSNAWLIFVIVVSCHQANEYHTTLCLGNGNMATIVFSFPTDNTN